VPPPTSWKENSNLQVQTCWQDDIYDIESSTFIQTQQYY